MMTLDKILQSTTTKGDFNNATPANPMLAQEAIKSKTLERPLSFYHLPL